MGLFLVDSYPAVNGDEIYDVGASYDDKRGQSFTAVACELDSAKFKIRKAGSPTGDVTVSIFAHTGTYGSGGTGTGSALATSDAIDASAIPGTAGFVTFNFSGANRITLVDGVKYVAVLEYTGGNASNRISLYTDLSSPTHSGNMVDYDGGVWDSSTAGDAPFEIYGVVPSKVLFLAGSAASQPSLASASTANYLYPMGSSTTQETNEARTQLKIREDGTLSNFGVYVISNGRSTNTTFTTRKNGGFGDQTITVGAGQTGRFEDASNTGDVTNGDLINFAVETGTGTGTITWNAISVVYEPDVGSHGYIGFTANQGPLAADRYFGFSSSAAGTTSLIGGNREIYSSVNISKLRVYVDVNTRTSNTGFYLQKNTSNSALSVSITAATTGEFEDLSNSVSFVDNDNANFFFDIVTGANSLNILNFQASTDNSISYIGCDRTGTAYNFGVTFYLPLAGDINNTISTESLARTDIPFDNRLKNLFVSIAANTVNGNSTYTLRKNGADTGIEVTVGSSQTGRFEDTDSVDSLDGSYFNFKVTTGGSSGTQNCRGCWIELTELGTVTNQATIQAKARIKVTGNDKTIQAKARMKVSGNDKTIQAKARMKVLGNDKTIQAKARVKNTISQTIQAKAYIASTGTEATIQAKSRIKQLDNDKTVQAKARVLKSFAQTAEAKSRILKVQTSTIQAKGKIKKLQSATIQAKANISNITLVTKTIQALARIFIAGTAQTIMAKSRLLVLQDADIQAKALISQLHSETAQARGRIKNSVSQTISAKSKIENATSQSIQAKAKVWAAHLGITFGLRGISKIQEGRRLSKTG